MKQQSLPASILATVLIVSTLVLLGILGILSLWQSQYLYSSKRNYDLQQQAHVKSAFVLYEEDHSLRSCLNPEGYILLYKEDSTSRVQFSIENWGLFEAVSVTSFNGLHQTRLYGQCPESEHQATLYIIPHKKQLLSLAGYCSVEGKALLPSTGMTYSRIRSLFFQGTPLDKRQIAPSEETLPPANQARKEHVEDLFHLQGDYLLPEEKIQVSFRDSLALFIADNYISGKKLSGKIILHTEESVFVENDNQLENIILVARKVEIADGTRGSLQVFARDSIIVGNEVTLLPGSGLWVSGHCATRRIQLGNNCEINGFIIVDKGDIPEDPPVAHYYQSPGSKVRGLVYVGGIADLQGIVNGSLYAERCYHFSPEGFYTNMLFNTVLLHHPDIIYPFWLPGAQERRGITCVH